MEPLISVLLPVYNCPRYVGAAIECMLAQAYADFELIVIDDGSTDSTPEVLRRYTDPRIRLFAQPNQGLAGTLNKGIGLARGRYIARQDQDDFSYPQRLARQVEFLETHQDCALVGTWAEIWVEDSRTARTHAHAENDADLQFELLFDNPFVHSSVMLRKSALEAAGGYSSDPVRQPPEDFELWSRLARRNEVANIPEILHAYREVTGSMSRDGVSPFVNRMVTICAENIGWASGACSSDPHVSNIAAITHRAESRLQGRPDFLAMRTVLRRAAIRTMRGEGPDTMRKADQRIRALRLRYWEMRARDHWPGRLLPAARSLVRLIRGH